MRIDRLHAMNFRNYDRLELEFDADLNIICGLNAQGKTNLLEALYVCGIGKSFRTNSDKDFIRMGQVWAAAGIRGRSGSLEQAIDIRWTEKGKKEIKVNQQGIERYADLLGRMSVVVFSPEDLKLVKEGPSERRRFLDREISHIRPGYYHHLCRYHRILAQRNKLLKQGFAKNRIGILEVLDEQMAVEGIRIMEHREGFVKRLAALARLKHRRLTDGKETLEIAYRPDIEKRPEEDRSEMENRFRKKLEERRERDLARGHTACGPHKDDLSLSINGVEVRGFGSQGQQRTAVLSLKLSEIESVKAERGEYPVLLLDDVMSELDERRQRELIGSLRNVQTFVTMTEIPESLKQSLENGKIFHVENGKVRALSAPCRIDQ